MSKPCLCKVAKCHWNRWWSIRPLYWAVQYLRRAFGEEDLRCQAVNLLDLQPNQLVLDLGCGLGANLRLLKRHDVRIVAADENSEYIEAARQEIRSNNWHHVRAIDWVNQRLPFMAGTFDAVFCAWGLTASHNVAKLLEEAHRLLKPNGKIVVLDLTHPGGPEDIKSLPISIVSSLTGHDSARPWIRQTKRIMVPIWETKVAFGAGLLLYGIKRPPAAYTPSPEPKQTSKTPDTVASESSILSSQTPQAQAQHCEPVKPAQAKDESKPSPAAVADQSRPVPSPALQAELPENPVPHQEAATSQKPAAKTTEPSGIAIPKAVENEPISDAIGQAKSAVAQLGRTEPISAPSPSSPENLARPDAAHKQAQAKHHGRGNAPRQLPLPSSGKASKAIQSLVAGASIGKRPVASLTSMRPSDKTPSPEDKRKSPFAPKDAPVSDTNNSPLRSWTTNNAGGNSPKDA